MRQDIIQLQTDAAVEVAEILKAYFLHMSLSDLFEHLDDAGRPWLYRKLTNTLRLHATQLANQIPPDYSINTVHDFPDPEGVDYAWRSYAYLPDVLEKLLSPNARAISEML
jgi:hypothetical protein